MPGAVFFSCRGCRAAHVVRAPRPACPICSDPATLDVIRTVMPLRFTESARRSLHLGDSGLAHARSFVEVASHG